MDKAHSTAARPVTLLVPGTKTLHTYATPARPDLTRCVVCRRRLVDRRQLVVGCDRCGVPMHEPCYVSDVASIAERITMDLTDEDFIFLCGSCRS